ncbi:AbrB/MazE/SpoVT family DNA-binding domain-containing protein [Effusibacillus lacus]|nr:AbrB family transcriptional regulator [Effusibacillus lacus]TCS76597.1 hypothetical protein EDD64_102144 [Effusibacillus lacus]
MNRKVTRIGNSLGVAITDALKQVGLGLGDDVDIVVRKEQGEIVIRKRVTVPEGFDPRFFDILTKNMEEYRETIEGLKDR